MLNGGGVEVGGIVDAVVLGEVGSMGATAPLLIESRGGDEGLCSAEAEILAVMFELAALEVSPVFATVELESADDDKGSLKGGIGKETLLTETEVLLPKLLCSLTTGGGGVPTGTMLCMQTNLKSTEQGDRRNKSLLGAESLAVLVMLKVERRVDVRLLSRAVMSDELKVTSAGRKAGQDCPGLVKEAVD
jgi:hypothetical protein